MGFADKSRKMNWQALPRQDRKAVFEHCWNWTALIADHRIDVQSSPSSFHLIVLVSAKYKGVEKNQEVRPLLVTTVVERKLFILKIAAVYSLHGQVLSGAVRNFWINENSSKRFCSRHFIAPFLMGSVAVRRYGCEEGLERSKGLFCVGEKEE